MVGGFQRGRGERESSFSSSPPMPPRLAGWLEKFCNSLIPGGGKGERERTQEEGEKREISAAAGVGIRGEKKGVK